MYHDSQSDSNVDSGKAHLAVATFLATHRARLRRGICFEFAWDSLPSAMFFRRLAGVGYRVATSPLGIFTGGGAIVGGIAAQPYLGNQKDFFSHKFIVEKGKDPDAIVDFYSTEEFLQILGIFPFAISFVLAGVKWEEERENAMNVWNMMNISFDITDKEEEIDGETVTTYFNKRERFVNYIPGTKILLWDQVHNFGFRRKSDGRIEVEHQGESFYGPWPVSFVVRLHAMYVIWAVQRHINSPLFGSEDLEAVEEQRSNIPLVAFNDYVGTLKAELSKVRADQFLNKQSTAKTDATLEKLTRLQKMDTIPVTRVTRLRRGVSVNSDSTTVRIGDPEAQNAIRAALRELDKIEGSQAAAKALRDMLENAEAPTTEAAKKEIRRRSSQVISVTG